MLRWVHGLKFGISVYDGVSPGLLATMSLSAGIKGSTNEQLVDSLARNKIISDECLIESMKQIDRKLFIPDLTHGLNPYENKPYKISGGQHMTDIFTHAVILERVSQHLKSLRQRQIREIRVLDVGTGHGYLAYAIAGFLAKMSEDPNSFCISAIDSNSKAIQYCLALNSQMCAGKLSTLIDFLNIDLEHFANRETNQYNVIIGGFYMSANLQSKLVPMLKKQTGLGIWATDGPNCQALFSYEPTVNQLHKQEIMCTLFSHNTVDNEYGDRKLEQSSKIEITQQRTLQQQQLRQQLKIGIKKWQVSKGRKMSLQEIRQIPELSLILEKLVKYK